MYQPPVHAWMLWMKMNETYLETISSFWSTIFIYFSCTEVFSGTLVQGWLGRPAGASTATWGAKTALGHSNGQKVGAIPHKLSRINLYTSDT